jgi:hypothetical protein
MVNEMAVPRIESAIKKFGEFLIRYGLVTVLGWIGGMKFTAYEAAGIQALVASSPLMSWMYKVFSLSNYLKHHWRNRDNGSFADCDSTDLGKTFGYRQRNRGIHFSGYPKLLVLFARLGEESRRISGAFGLGRVSIERHGSVRCGTAYTWRRTVLR